MRILKNKIENVTNTFPSEERCRLTNQITRSVRSVNTSIAEGHDYSYLTSENLTEWKTELTGVEKNMEWIY